MVKLSWLQVNKFRTVKPGTRLTFNPSHNVLLGQNGTGKTTLLNLVAAAVKSNFADFKDEEFDLSYELASDEATATISVRNENRALPIPSELEGLSILQHGALTSERGLLAPVLSLTMSVSSTQADFQVRLDFKGDRGSAFRVNQGAPSTPFEIEFSDIKDMPTWMLIISGLAQWGNKASFSWDSVPGIFNPLLELKTTRFDESLQYFENLGELDYQVTRHFDGRISSYGTLGYVSDIQDQLRGLAQSNWGADRYVLTDTSLQFLRHTTQLLDFASAEAIIELKDSTKHDQGETMHLGNLRFYFSHRGGWKISERSLSYGQKRMLAFMHYLHTTNSTVIADELVNGLHHRWIRACFEALGQRQVFLTSQNPLLLDYLGFQSPEEVRSTFVLCRWEKGPEQMVWENMTQEAAQDFFDSYKVGFQQVGELLQSKGLW